MRLTRFGLVCLVAFSLTAVSAAGSAAPRAVLATSETKVKPSQSLAVPLTNLFHFIAEKSGCAVDPLGLCVPAPAATADPVCPGNDPQACLEWR
jgi:hypothetical protein